MVTMNDITRYDRMHSVATDEIMPLDVLHMRYKGDFFDVLVLDVVCDDTHVVMEVMTVQGVTTLTLPHSRAWVIGDAMDRTSCVDNDADDDCGCSEFEFCAQHVPALYPTVRHPESFWVQADNGQLVPECVLDRMDARAQQAKEGKRDPREVSVLPYGPTYTPDPIVDGQAHDLHRAVCASLAWAKQYAWFHANGEACEPHYGEAPTPWVDETAEWIKLAERKANKTKSPTPVYVDPVVVGVNVVDAALEALMMEVM